MMKSSYKNKLKNSLYHRSQITAQPTGWIVALIVVGLVIYILIVILKAPDGRPEYHFDKERGAITVLSAILLSMASGFAGTCFLIKQNNIDWLRFFWLLTAFGFLFFAFDELLQFHERLGEIIKRSPVSHSQTFRNWNDVVVIGYGIVAIPILIYFLPEILRFPKVAEMFVVAFSCYGIHTIIDSTQTRTGLSIILEESAKLFSSAFFALSMLFGILNIVTGLRNSQAK